MKGFYTVIAFLAFITLSKSQLVEIERECDRIPCVNNQVSTVSLTCGNSGERITKVLFASYGTPSGTCPDSSLTNLGADDYNLNATTGCDLAESKSIIEKACVGKVFCNVDISDATSGLSDGTLGCGLATKEYTVAVACKDTFNVFGLLATGVIALIGFALGATVTVEFFKSTWADHKRAVLIGWLCQFGFMPLVAYLYIVIFEVKPLVALGVILCGSVPGGTTSNLMTYYAKGNVALSIIMSVASTVCALFMLPFLLFLYGTVALSFDGDVAVPFVDIIGSLFVVIIPVSLGIYIRAKSEKWAKRVEIVGSVLGLLFLLAALVTGIVQNPDLFNPQLLQKTWIGAALFQPIGAMLGAAVAKMFKLTGPEFRAVVLETGIQNYTIAIAIAGISFTGCERAVVLTFILAASFWYIINSAWLTLLLRWSSKFDDEEEQKEAMEGQKLDPPI